ncbi:MAG TPA: helix-turn-helix domain-containing protein [Pseudonocardiaceae bacterium]|nr:helix-turn-helix domain-containing protein [Pseudonocardiaceae bacterium]
MIGDVSIVDAPRRHISLRCSPRLFEPEGTTVAEWVRIRRLEHCHHDLIDPALRDRPVAAVAARWGFASAAHFTRLFGAT